MIVLKEILSLAKKQALLQYHENHDKYEQYHMQGNKVRETRYFKKYNEIRNLESELEADSSSRVFKILAVNEHERRRKSK